MPCCILSCRLGPSIEVYRNQSRPLHIDDGAIHVRRRPGHRNVSVLVRRPTSSSSSHASSSISVIVPRLASSPPPLPPAHRPRYYYPSPSPTPSPELLVLGQPQIIEVEPSSEFHQRRCYRSSAPSPEPVPVPVPRQHYHSHFHQQVPGPGPGSTPAPVPAPPPPPLPPEVNSLGERVETLTARNTALEAEMRELREQFRAARMLRDERMTARMREEILTSRPRRCGECGLVVGASCRCGEYTSSSTRRRGVRQEVWNRDRDRDRERERDRDRGRYGLSEVVIERRTPSRQRRRSVRWVDELD